MYNALKLQNIGNVINIILNKAHRQSVADYHEHGKLIIIFKANELIL